MGLGLRIYLADYGKYPGIGQWTQRSGITNSWVRLLRPYTHQVFGQPLYDCPGFPLDLRERLSISRFEDMLDGAYAYNSQGTESVGNGKYGLGLEHWLEGRVERQVHIPESRVLHPSKMAEIGDQYTEGGYANTGLTRQVGFQYSSALGDTERARVSSRKRHTGVFNVVFGDGHIEHFKPSRLFGQSDAEMSRLNNDHKPHRELTGGEWPVIRD